MDRYVIVVSNVGIETLHWSMQRDKFIKYRFICHEKQDRNKRNETMMLSGVIKEKQVVLMSMSGSKSVSQSIFMETSHTDNQKVDSSIKSAIHIAVILFTITYLSKN